MWLQRDVFLQPHLIMLYGRIISGSVSLYFCMFVSFPVFARSQSGLFLKEFPKVIVILKSAVSGYVTGVHVSKTKIGTCLFDADVVNIFNWRHSAAGPGDST